MSIVLDIKLRRANKTYYEGVIIKISNKKTPSNILLTISGINNWNNPHKLSTRHKA